MKLAVIGAGAAGLMCGGALSKAGFDVTIFDGNEKSGKKLYITGKGRCNITNDCDKSEYLDNVVNGKKFLQSAISKFTPQDCISYFEMRGLKIKVERGKRVFPASDKASDVTKVLQRECDRVEFRFNEKVLSISPYETKFKVKTESAAYIFDRVVVATGGKTYSATGSSGDGYKFAKMLGHNVIEPKPALVPIKLKDRLVNLQGLPLKNVALIAEVDGKKIGFFGEMLFTDVGITGPVALTMSSYINRAEKVNLSIDLKPALSSEMLEVRLQREIEEDKNKKLFNLLRRLLPKNFIEFFLKKLGGSGEQKVNSITVSERKNIIKLLKSFPLEYAGLYDLEAGVVTSGGVDLKEINPSTMESKLVKGVYFIRSTRRRLFDGWI